MLTGKLRPDNSFTIGYVPPVKKWAKDSQYERDFQAQYYKYELDSGEQECLHIPSIDEETCQVLGIEYKGTGDSVLMHLDDILWYFKDLKRNFPHFLKFIFCPKFSQKPKPKKRYGLKGITPNGRRVVKNGAFLMQRDYGRERLGFLTLTIPAYDREALGILAREWSEVKRRFIQEFRRALARENAPTDIVECTEIQENRLKNRDEFAPHSHICYVASPDRRPIWYVDAHKLRAMWQRICESVLSNHGYETHTEWGASINCQRVKKSVRNYLGKYMTKGAKAAEYYKEQGYEDCIPHHWWYVSSDLKKQIIKETVIIDKHTAEYISLNHEDLQKEGIIAHCYDIVVTFKDGTQHIIGCVGELTHKGRTFFDRHTPHTPSWQS